MICLSTAGAFCVYNKALGIAVAPDCGKLDVAVSRVLLLEGDDDGRVSN